MAKRIKSKPGIFSGRKIQTTTNSVKRGISNSSLGGRDTSNENFLLDSYRSGFKSTQQLSIDFEKFENHTFFSPARAKVDVALFKAINEYPFTGTSADVDRFLTQLTGFEKYVFDNIPKNIGYLFFSGTQTGETTGGTYIRVSPYAGNLFNDVPGATGDLKLQVDDSPFEIEAHIYVPDIQNENQILVQRVQSEAGFTLALSSSSSTQGCKILFLVSSASDSYVVASGSLQKGVFSHVRACLLDEQDGKKAQIFVNNEILASSSDIQDFGNLSFSNSYFTIGSGSTHSILDYSFSPAQTFSGALDEFRFFKSQRSDEEAEKYAKTQIFASESLGLYFRFDEPSGSYDLNSVILDNSGNCLHSLISNFSQSLRSTSSIENPMTLQNSNYSPVLYPDYEDFATLIEDLIVSASDYDEDNPNCVINLVPVHYLQESSIAAGLPLVDSGLGEIPTLESIPGTGKLSEISPLLKILVTLSIPMDEIKQFVDSMSNLLAIELGSEDKINSQMIAFAGDYFGIDLPNFFAKSSSEQFSMGQNIVENDLTTYTLRSLRDDLWRRIIATMPHINSSKGTKNAIRSVLLAAGIIPENFFTIREFGMSGESSLDDLRDQAVEVTSMLDFSGSFTAATGSLVSPGVRLDSPRIISPFLSGSRTEIGFPSPRGSFVNKNEFPPHGISDTPGDGLLTSGSFSLEASFVFDKRLSHSVTQSLLRIMTTGSTSPFDYLVGNVIYKNDNINTGSISFVVSPSAEAAAVSPDPLVLTIEGPDLFDGERWTVGIQKERGDALGILSSSYTLRCARNVGGKTDLFKTSSYYSEVAVNPSSDVFTNIVSQYNESGSYFIIGSQSFGASTRFLNSESQYNSTLFTGKVSHIKFATTTIDDTSFAEHASNFSSIGYGNPEISLGFDLIQTGAFARLRIDASCDQATTSSDSAGDVRIFDFSQNYFHLSGSGFGSNKQIIKPFTTSINRISPRFDLQQVSNKVRLRGLENPTNSDPDYVITGPAYEIYDVNEIVDDVRFAIEHSVVKALNEDIVSTVGNVQYLDDVWGNPAEMFSDSYSGLDHFSSVYFNRLTDKIDMMRTYDVFRWVDIALTNLVESILPKRTKFLGINYIVEPHILERGKLRYRTEQMYLLSKSYPNESIKKETLEFVSPSTIPTITGVVVFP